MGKKRSNPSAPSSTTRATETQEIATTPPTKVVGLSMFANGYYWYELSCCTGAPQEMHSGMFVTTQQQEVRTCPNNPVIIIPEEEVIVGDVVNDPIQQARRPPPEPFSHFYGSFPQVTNSDEPLGKVGYEVIQYIELTELEGENSQGLENRICKLIRPASEKEVFVAYLLDSGATVNARKGKAKVLSRSTRIDGNPGRLFGVDLSIFTGRVETTWHKVFLLGDAD